MKNTKTSRAQGALMGQLCGDWLGSLVEFMAPAQIRARYPDGLCETVGSDIWRTLPGQPTDDSEMALALARMLVAEKAYTPQKAYAAYRRWLASDPFDCGQTVYAGLAGDRNHRSQANGALMRIAPLGIFGTQLPDDQLDRHSMEDAALTHPHPACLQANVIFVRLIAAAINGLTDRQELYRMALIIADSFNEKTVIKEAVYRAVKGQVRDATDQMGWVAIALQNALWQLLYAPDFESGVMDTILQGGDTDTNAAICGALLGAVEGLEAIPPRWQKTVLGCKPQRGDPGVFRPRPTEYWPVDALDLARRLKGER